MNEFALYSLPVVSSPAPASSRCSASSPTSPGEGAMIIESGVIIFLGLLLHLRQAARAPGRCACWAIRWRSTSSSSVLAYSLHWGTFSGVMAAAVAGLMCSGFTTVGRHLFGWIDAAVYHAGVFPVASLVLPLHPSTPWRAWLAGAFSFGDPIMSDLYQNVTDRIVAALEQGAPPWVRPWSHAAPTRSRSTPQTRTSLPRRQLRPADRSKPAATATPVNRWLTYRQALRARRPGPPGRAAAPPSCSGSCARSRVTRRGHPEPDDEPDLPDKVIPLLRAYTVFNVAQVDGLPAEYCAEPVPNWEPEAKAEELLADVRRRHPARRLAAYYQPGERRDPAAAPSGVRRRAPATTTTALHELTHWTGHPSRCNRQLGRSLRRCRLRRRGADRRDGRGVPLRALPASTASCSTRATWRAGCKVLRARQARDLRRRSRGAAGGGLRAAARPAARRRGRWRPDSLSSDPGHGSSRGLLHFSPKDTHDPRPDHPTRAEDPRRAHARRPTLASPDAVRDYLRLLLHDRAHEVFVCVFLDAQHRVIACDELFRGTLGADQRLPARGGEGGAGAQRGRR